MLSLVKSLWKKEAKAKKLISLLIQNDNDSTPVVVKVPKHLLVEQSAVFRSMAEKGELRGSREIKLDGVLVVAMQKISEYLENGSVTFQDHFEAIETLKAANKYELQTISNICSDFLITAICIGSVCEIYEFAATYEHYTLEYYCLKFIDEHTDSIVESPSFLTLKGSTITNLIKRHSLKISSEIVLFRGILTWGLNDCLRRGVDEENDDELFNSVKPLMAYVRFLTMTEEELAEPDVEHYNTLNSGDLFKRTKSLLGLESKRRTSSADSSCLQPRKHITEYIHEFEVVDYDEHPVKNGETFTWRVEVLKGRVFLAAVTLGFDRFIDMKNTACLYVALSATNFQTTEQKCARGTFLNTSEDEELKFPTPLIAKESEVIDVVLKVKRADNICPMKIKDDVQIAIPDSKTVAMKITPSLVSGESKRCIIKNIKYFF